MENSELNDVGYIEKIEELEDDASSEAITSSEQYTNAVIRTYTSDTAFKTIMDGIEDGLYEIPKFQRFYKWNTSQAEELATSLVRGMPIPPIYVYRTEEGVIRILDGQQRIISLYLYYKGKTRRPRQVLDFRSGSIKELVCDSYKFKDYDYHMHFYKDTSDGPLQEQCVGISYNKLPDATRRKVDYRGITVVEIQVDDTKYRRNNLFKIFANLNSGGTPLSAQELRNGLYGSEFYDMLFKINDTNYKWQRHYGDKNKDAKDIELLLRFCALYVRTSFNGKKGALTVEPFNKYINMLNEFSEEATSFSKEQIDIFEKKLTAFIENYGIAYKESIALCEVSFIVTAFCPELLPRMTDDRLHYIRESETFRSTISGGTANMKKIETRLGVVYSELSRTD